MRRKSECTSIQGGEPEKIYMMWGKSKGTRIFSSSRVNSVFLMKASSYRVKNSEGSDT
jgi:hypothetical protein